MKSNRLVFSLLLGISALFADVFSPRQAAHASLNQTVEEFIDEYVFLKSDFGSTTIDRTLSKPSCHILVQMWFDVMRSVKGLGMFLSIFSLLAMVLYFITSSDSGSLIIDSSSSL